MSDFKASKNAIAEMVNTMIQLDVNPVICGRRTVRKAYQCGIIRELEAFSKLHAIVAHTLHIHTTVTAFNKAVKEYLFLE